MYINICVWVCLCARSQAEWFFVCFKIVQTLVTVAYSSTMLNKHEIPWAIWRQKLFFCFHTWKPLHLWNIYFSNHIFLMFKLSKSFPSWSFFSYIVYPLPDYYFLFSGAASLCTCLPWKITVANSKNANQSRRSL